jgi:hypothetical protein
MARWFAVVARRSLLQHALRVASAATVLCAAPNLAGAAPKISQKAVAYQDHPEGNKRCDNCLQFQPPDACKTVEGPISPQGSCRIFQAARR